jgi:alkanesulfonate monooxygenase SsuD/methylene tetrahydromethanopterin reductase-like flavin-dependent oxidoreductase (luciferase family)
MIFGMATPFTFLADAFDVSSARELGERARAAEDLGVTTFVLPDHLVAQPAPVPYLAAVAALTERIRVSAFVHNNDLRHPAVLAQELATLDVLSEGRLDVDSGRDGTKPLRTVTASALPRLPDPDRVEGQTDSGVLGLRSSPWLPPR